MTFHSQDPNMLLSGSQDGTMKCFDIRMKVAAMTYVRYKFRIMYTRNFVSSTFVSICESKFKEMLYENLSFGFLFLAILFLIFI